MACNDCNGNILGIPNAKEKLGRCTFCIISAIVGTLASWVLYYFFRGKQDALIFIIVGFLFSLLLLSHIFAYVYRKLKR